MKVRKKAGVEPEVRSRRIVLEEPKDDDKAAYVMGEGLTDEGNDCCAVSVSDGKKGMELVDQLEISVEVEG